MKSTPPKIFLAGYLFFCSLLFSIPVSAQIAVDGTTSSKVTNNNSDFTINGGNRAGGNLFHSFQEFSVPTGGSANFNNAPDVDNIINRVTGGSISNIDGLLKANYNANLFLINPAGIIFGQNARLNLGGSFYGSTANSILFPEGVEFAANNLQPPILTINAPIGLSFRDNPGDIVVRGNGNGPRLSEELVNSQDGLQVNPDRTLALIGGNLTLEGANLITRGGRIELGSVEGNQQVSLTNLDGNFSLDYQGLDSFRDIQLSQRTTVNASGDGGGEVRLQGRNITLNESSAILADTLSNLNGKGIDIQASEIFQMADRAFISTSTIDRGEAGPLTIQAKKEIKLTGDGIANLDVFLDTELFAQALLAPEADARLLRENGGLFAVSLGGKRGGDITMETGKLLLQNGFIVINSTIRQGGMGGNAEIRASESVKIINSAFFSTTVDNSAKAGNITIDTNKLRLEGLGGILTSTLSNSGTGGDISIYATESVELISSTSGELILPEGIRSDSVENSADAGNIVIKTSQLLLNRGEINTATDGTGDGNGGDIMLKLDDNLVMRNNGRITAEALKEANGGNIDIDAQFIIAFPSQNDGNDIITSAKKGKGGNIDISAKAVLGIRERKESDLTNDINASSEFSQDGNINIRTPDVDATQGLTELPQAIIESEKIVTQDCSYGRGATGNSSFTIEGKGGVSPELTAPLTSDNIYIEEESVTSEAKQDNEREIVTLVEREKPLVMDEIVPAKGAIILDNGDVILTAYPTANDNPRSAIDSHNCQTSLGEQGSRGAEEQGSRGAEEQRSKREKITIVRNLRQNKTPAIKKFSKE